MPRIRVYQSIPVGKLKRVQFNMLNIRTKAQSTRSSFLLEALVKSGFSKVVPADQSALEMIFVFVAYPLLIHVCIRQRRSEGLKSSGMHPRKEIYNPPANPQLSELTLWMRMCHVIVINVIQNVIQNIVSYLKCILDQFKLDHFLHLS